MLKTAASVPELFSKPLCPAKVSAQQVSLLAAGNLELTKAPKF